MKIIQTRMSLFVFTRMAELTRQLTATDWGPTEARAIFLRALSPDPSRAMGISNLRANEFAASAPIRFARVASLSRGRDWPAIRPDVFRTSGKARATVRSTSDPVWKANTRLSVERLDKPCARPDRPVPGCEEFASAFFGKSHRSRGGARRNALSASRAIG